MERKEETGREKQTQCTMKKCATKAFVFVSHAFEIIYAVMFAGKDSTCAQQKNERCEITIEKENIKC